jgi:hypothetical protein
MNIWRKLLAAKLRDNCGYQSRDITSPIEFNVAIDNVDFSPAYLVKKAIESGEVSQKGAARDPVLMQHLEREWDEKHQARVWEWVREQMWEGVTGKHPDDYLRSYGAETARRYGLPFEVFPKRYRRRSAEMAYHPAAKPGWILVEPYQPLYFDVRFGLYGRGGKHLCVESFEGVDLASTSADDLADGIECYTGGDYSNRWCRNLLAMMGEWEQQFTTKVVRDEAEYQAAGYIAQDVTEWYQKKRDAAREARERKFWERRDVVTCA